MGVFTPETLDVVMVSFEGPDQYSQAGGLGVRARELCRAIAAHGFSTTLIFIGDPSRPMVEEDQGVRLIRWARDVSKQFPNGVYEGEHAKIREVLRTLPAYVVDAFAAMPQKMASSSLRTSTAYPRPRLRNTYCSTCYLLPECTCRPGERTSSVLPWGLPRLTTCI